MRTALRRAVLAVIEVVSNGAHEFERGAATAIASGYVEGVVGGESFLQTTRVDNRRITINAGSPAPPGERAGR